MFECELVFRGNKFNLEFESLDEMRVFYFEARDNGAYEFKHGVENFILPFESSFMKYRNDQLKTDEA